MVNESYTLLDNKIWEDENLSHAEFRVLSYLIRMYSLEHGYSFPTREQIIKKCHVNPKTLNSVLNTLEAKGYITRGKHKTETGWNNIYYIHKYLVVNNFDNKTVSEPQREVSDNQSINNSTDNIKPLTNENTEPINQELELTANEQLLYREGIQKLNSEQKELLNKLDTDRLIKTIEIAKQNTNNLNFNYLIKIYNNNFKKKTAPKTTEEPHKDNNGKAVKGAYQQVFTGDKKDYVNNNYPVKTKYHGTFNEHWRKYSEEELEAKLLKVQNSKNKVGY